MARKDSNSFSIVLNSAVFHAQKSLVGQCLLCMLCHHRPKRKTVIFCSVLQCCFNVLCHIPTPGLKQIKVFSLPQDLWLSCLLFYPNYTRFQSLFHIEMYLNYKLCIYLFKYVILEPKEFCIAEQNKNIFFYQGYRVSVHLWSCVICKKYFVRISLKSERGLLS